MNESLKRKLESGRQFRRNDIAPELRIADPDGSADSGAMIVEGHFATFNQPYELYSFRDGWNGMDVHIMEQIDPHAFDETDESDVIMLYDHAGRVMARNRNNTLEISVDETGPIARADLSKSELGPGLYRDIQNGIVDRMSFAFTIAEQEETKTTDNDNKVVTILRTITKIGKLYDVSAVSIPANDGTDISARSYIDGVINELEAERLKKQESERRRRILALHMAIAEFDKEDI